MPGDVLGDGLDDTRIDVDEVVAAHAGLAGHTGGHDDDVAAGRRLVGRGARDGRVEAFDGGRLEKIQCLSLRHAIDLRNVDEHDVAEFLAGGPDSRAGANIACTNDRNLRTFHVCFLSLLAILGPGVLSQTIGGIMVKVIMDATAGVGGGPVPAV